MIDSARNRLGYPAALTSLVLPMAVSLFRITSPIQYIASASFIAWAMGIDLTAAQLTTGVALSVLVSMGSVGLPGQVSFMATNMPVSQAMGLPVRLEVLTGSKADRFYLRHGFVKLKEDEI